MITLYFIGLFSFLLLCVLLCFVILIQESKTTGLGASFGGDANESLFGASTADVLKKFTGYLAAVFLISCIFLSIGTQAMGRPVSKESAPQEIEKQM